MRPRITLIANSFYSYKIYANIQMYACFYRNSKISFTDISDADSNELDIDVWTEIDNDTVDKLSYYFSVAIVKYLTQPHEN